MPIQSCRQSVGARLGKRYTEFGLLLVPTVSVILTAGVVPAAKSAADCTVMATTVTPRVSPSAPAARVTLTGLPPVLTPSTATTDDPYNGDASMVMSVCE